MRGKFAARSTRSCLRLAQSPGPDTSVSDERREHHCCDEEYSHAQQDHIDDVTLVIDDDGALPTQGFDRPGHLAAHFRAAGGQASNGCGPAAIGNSHSITRDRTRGTGEACVYPERGYGISEGLRRTGYARPPRNRADENRYDSGPPALAHLAHDVPLAMMPSARAVVMSPTAKGAPCARHGDGGIGDREVTGHCGGGHGSQR